MKKYLKKAARIAVIVLTSYAILFSITATVLLTIAAWQILQPVLQVRQLRTNNPQESAYMESIRGEPGPEQPSDSLIHTFVPLDSISKHLINCVVASEDDGFHTHPGFDLAAIARAFEKNRTRGEIKYGGSTITQQLAKNLFLYKRRTFSRKAKELAYTVLMEHFLGKDRILELYLNYAQWGDRIFGCEAASHHYFNKPSAKLTLGEAARLAAILAKPTSINPHSASSIFLGKRLQVIADNLYMKRLIGESAYKHLSGHPPPGNDTTEVSEQDSLEARLSF